MLEKMVGNKISEHSFADILFYSVLICNNESNVPNFNMKDHQ